MVADPRSVRQLTNDGALLRVVCPCGAEHQVYNAIWRRDGQLRCTCGRELRHPSRRREGLRPGRLYPSDAAAGERARRRYLRRCGHAR